MKYLIVMEQADDASWWVRVPDLPGCFSWGATPADAVRNAEEAIRGHIGVMRDHGDAVPNGLNGDERVEIVEVTEAR
jgi:predicted RNase H-like HicB family nuclease